MKTILILTFIFGLNFTVMAIDSSDEIDVLDLAAMLIQNNNLTRAESTLRRIQDPNDVQTDRFYLLKGILAQKQTRVKESLKFLELAEKSKVESKYLALYYETLAKSLLMNKNFKEAIKVLKTNSDLLKERPLYYQVFSETLMKSKQEEEGWALLSKGIHKFPKHLGLFKQKWFYLFSSKLFTASKDFLFSKVNQLNFSGLDLAKFAYQYRSVKELKTAAELGEMARMVDPQNEDVGKELARIYIENGEIFSAATVFEDLARYKPKLIADASELWRKAGYLAHSERLSLKIPEVDKAVKQKMTIALQQQNFARISSLSRLVDRGSLKKDEDVVYTLAYSFFMLGNYRKAEKYLTNITRKDLLTKSLSLRKTMEECSREVGACL
jgi:tetratricopeptide (TPR) repeat protein